jgi:hypothetical protein
MRLNFFVLSSSILVLSPKVATLFFSFHYEINVADGSRGGGRVGAVCLHRWINKQRGHVGQRQHNLRATSLSLLKH